MDKQAEGASSLDASQSSPAVPEKFGKIANDLVFWLTGSKFRLALEKANLKKNDDQIELHLTRDATRILYEEGAISRIVKVQEDENLLIPAGTEVRIKLAPALSATLGNSRIWKSSEFKAVSFTLDLNESEVAKSFINVRTLSPDCEIRWPVRVEVCRAHVSPPKTGVPIDTKTLSWALRSAQEFTNANTGFQGSRFIEADGQMLWASVSKGARTISTPHFTGLSVCFDGADAVSLSGTLRHMVSGSTTFWDNETEYGFSDDEAVCSVVKGPALSPAFVSAETPVSLEIKAADFTDAVDKLACQDVAGDDVLLWFKSEDNAPGDKLFIAARVANGSARVTCGVLSAIAVEGQPLNLFAWTTLKYLKTVGRLKGVKSVSLGFHDKFLVFKETADEAVITTIMMQKASPDEDGVEKQPRFLSSMSVGKLEGKPKVPLQPSRKLLQSPF